MQSEQVQPFGAMTLDLEKLQRYARFKEAAQATAIGVAKGFSQQMEQLAEGARKASTALGRDFEDVDRLVRGIEPKSARTFGRIRNYTSFGKCHEQIFSCSVKM